MATLNTLRTRFGVVLSAVIAFALLAFIFSLKAEMGFSGNDPVVAQINGHDVTMSEYSSEYNKVQRQSGVTEIDEQQANMLFAATWQSLISEFSLQPGFQSMGLEVGAAERLAIISGAVPTQAMYSAFADPSTGAYNSNAVNSFLLTSQGNPEAEAVWAMLSEQARNERQANKYMALVMAGLNYNSLEVENGVNGANKIFSGRWVRKAYNSIPDSLVALSKSDIKSYYEANKSVFKRQPSRNISFVTFNVAPSASDIAELESEATAVGEEFRATTDLRGFIRENRNGSISDGYFNEAQLPAGEASALVSGEMYGPISNGDSWRMSRIFDVVEASDTLALRHIVLSYTDQELVDSLKVALRQGANFAQAAAAHSVFSQTAQVGGELGELPFSAFTDEFAAALAPAKAGDIVEVASGDMIQLIQVYDASKRNKHYRVASIDIPILPSDATRRAAHNAAGTFAVAAKGGNDKFKVAATDSEVSPRTASLTSSSRSIDVIAGSQEVARWAHRAEIGDLSEIFKVTDGYVVAMLTAIDDSEFISYDEIEGSVRRILMNNKKFEMLKGDVKGSTFDEISSNLEGSVDGEFSEIGLGSYYVAGLGVEPKLIGSISSTKSTGVASAPVQGNVGMYIFEVTDIVTSEEPQTAEAEKVRLESTQQRLVQQSLFGALEGISNVKDMRGANL
ncbi:MAG: peptidylprolyl isomerase [Rikenellaceae bacterium]